MNNFTAFIVAAATLFSLSACNNRLSLPENYKEINSAFNQAVGKIDPAQSWNVAYQGTTLTGLEVTPVTTKAVTKGNGKGNSTIDYATLTKTSAEYFKVVWGNGNKMLQIKIEQIISDWKKVNIGIYYYNDDKEKVETILFEDTSTSSYSKNNVNVTLGGDYFGTFIECYDANGNVTKFYSESKYNSDKIGHAKYISKDSQISGSSDHPYIFMDDAANGTDCTNVILKIVSNEDITGADAPAGIDDEEDEDDIEGLDSDLGPWLVICEDLGNVADNDFNDVIFQVSRKSATSIEITFMAGGCTLPNYVYLGEELLGEIHSIFGVEDNSIMINTTGIDYPFVKITRTVPESFTMGSEDMGGFKIIRESAGSRVYSSSCTGSAPLMICVPSTYKWASEMTRIWDAYPQFKAWAQDHTVNTDWYDHPAEGMIVER